MLKPGFSGAIFVLLLFFLFIGCGTEPGTALVTAEVDTSRPIGEDPDATARATSNQALTLRMGEATVARGETACLPVVAQNFRNLIGFQYTIRWDSTALEYHSIRQFGLPGYGPANFGDRFAGRGYLSTLWTEAGLQGASRPDGSTLFELCLTNRAKPGTESTVRFSNGPTTFEVIAADNSQWKFRYANGRIVSK